MSRRPFPGRVSTLSRVRPRAARHLSDVKYAACQGLGGQRLVEMPSQVIENWATEPEVIRPTRALPDGEVIPDDLIAKMSNAKLFNQGFAPWSIWPHRTSHDWHTLTVRPADLIAYEAQRMGDSADSGDHPRYRSPYFRHIFSGGYSPGTTRTSGPSVDADAFQAFKEAGCSTRNAGRFRK